MIQAKDLRLGNLVKGTATEFGVIKAISEKSCSIEQIGYSLQCQWPFEVLYSGINPIILTQEILEKCGWVWNEECNSFEKYPNGDARMNLQFREVNSSYTMFNYVLKAKISDKIYYLHQLQNLFYFLCGEELEVKL